jgi:hypothetical protein
MLRKRLQPGGKALKAFPRNLLRNPSSRNAVGQVFVAGTEAPGRRDGVP